MTDEDLASVAQSRVGRVLRGKYRLDRVLGVGGMAVVYAATHRNKKRFAIKMLHPHLSLGQDVRTRFLREGYVANSVEHPGAVAVLDDDVAEDGSAFIVMELLAGAPLDEVWERHGREMPFSAVLSVADAVLDVLSAAHAHRIVHRDVKPANLFLTTDGRLRVLDFGIAQLRDASAGGTTAPGAMLGTPAYMAPEQALAKSSEVDAQTDLWAVGATMFLLITGQTVHAGENAPQLLVNAATRPARSIASVAEIPEGVAAVIDRALAFEKKERWASATEMRAALAKACREATGASIPPLPRAESTVVTGLEDTVASSEDFGGSGGLGFAPTAVQKSGRAETLTPIGSSGRTTKPSARYPSERRRGRLAWIGAGIAAVLVAGAGVTWRARFTTAPAAQVAVAQPEARAGATPATAGAAAAYEAALTAMSDGKPYESERKLEATVAQDPAFGPAYLRLAFQWSMGPTYDEDLSRSFYEKTLEHRATLGDEDAALLEAWEPRFRTPPDRAERLARMKRVTERFPNDLYALLLLGISAKGVNELDVADAAFDRALAIDPHFAPSYANKSDLATRRGDVAKAKALLEDCLRASPDAVACYRMRFSTASREGRCEDAAKDAKRVLAIDPDTKEYHFALAQVLAALGESSGVIGEILRRAGTFVPEGDKRRIWELESEKLGALLSGDFEAADRALGEEIILGRGGASLNPVADAIERARVLLEEGDRARARTLLQTVRAGILEHDTGDPSELEHQAVFLNLEVESGAASHDRLRAEQARLTRAAKEWQAKGVGHVEGPVLWKRIYVDATDAEEAVDALAALPGFGPITETCFGEPDMALTLGRIDVLGGRAAEAVPLLRRATSACTPLDDVLQSTSALYWLGLALEQTGDVAGARESYEKVLARWGTARPRSLTADKARAALARLKSKGP